MPTCSWFLLGCAQRQEVNVSLCLYLVRCSQQAWTLSSLINRNLEFWACYCGLRPVLLELQSPPSEPTHPYEDEEPPQA